MAFPHILFSPSLAPTVMATASDATTLSATTLTLTIIGAALAADRVGNAPANVVNLFTADCDSNPGRVADMVISPARALPPIFDSSAPACSTDTHIVSDKCGSISKA